MQVDAIEEAMSLIGISLSEEDDQHVLKMISGSVETMEQEPNYFDAGAAAEIKRGYDQILSIIRSIGGSESKYKDEARSHESNETCDCL